jgi:peptide/nickel transport system substrate-binding protein
LKALSLSSCIFVCVALFLTACGSGDGEAGTPTAAVTTAVSSEPRYGGNFIFGISVEPQTFNGLYISDTASLNIANMIFVNLMQPNERLEMVPRLAAGEPEISADGTVWTLRLRRGVKFHDGVELTAADVAFTYGALIDPAYASPRAGAFQTLTRVAALDDYTVQFTLSEPNARFGTLLVYPILPKHLLEHVPPRELAEYREFNVDRPIGAGPFRFGSWVRGQTLVLEAFEDHFDGRPYLDRFTFRFVPNSSAGVLLLETGEIDEFLVPVTDVPTVERMPHVTLHGRLAPGYAHIGWNLRNPLFADRRVRQALTHAIDREEVIAAVLGGHARVAHAPVSPLVEWAYTDDVPQFPYDPDKARALLAAAGWVPGPRGILEKDGRPFSFKLLTTPGLAGSTDLAVIVQQYLREVGVEVEPEQLEFGAYLRRYRPPSFDFDAYVGQWSLAVDPDPSQLWHSREIAAGQNYLGFRNARVDELADRNWRLLDRAERAAVLHEVWRIIAEEQPSTFLYYPQQFFGLKSDVRGFVNNPQLGIYEPHKYWLDR